MNVAPLQLRQYFVTEIRITARRQFKAKEGWAYNVQNLGSDIKCHKHDKETGKWRVALRLRYNSRPDENVPYDFSIAIVGLFEVLEKWPTAKAKSLVCINAPAMLYSAAREIIAMISGRGPWGTMLLPSMNFMPVPKRNGAARAQGRKPSKKRKE